MPVGACWARAEVAAAFVPGDHGSTFGGQPLAMSAARATLAVMEAEDVPARARRRRGPPAGRAGGARPGWPRSGARGCCWPPCSPATVAGQAVPPRRWHDGLVVNAPRPDVLRFAPVAAGVRRRDRRGRGHRGRVLGRWWPDRGPARGRPGEDGHGRDRARPASAPGVDPPRPRRRRPRRRRPGRGAGAGRAGSRPSSHRSWPDGAWPWCSRSRPTAPATAPRWPSVALGGHPVYIQGHEVGIDTRESAEPTWPAPWPATTPSSAPGCSTTRSLDADGRRPRRRRRRPCRWSTCSPTGPTRARPWPTCSPSARCSADVVAGRTVAYVGDANNVWRSLALAAAMVGIGHPRRLARRATDRPRPTSTWSASVRGRPEVTADPIEAVAGVDARLHRRVDVDGPGGRGRSPSAGLRRVPGRRAR